MGFLSELTPKGLLEYPGIVPSSPPEWRNFNHIPQISGPPVEGRFVVEPLHHERVLLPPGEGVGDVQRDSLGRVGGDGGGDERGDGERGDPHAGHWWQVQRKKSFCFGVEILSIKTLEDVKVDEYDGLEEGHVGDWLERHSETESCSLLLASKWIHTHNHVNLSYFKL